MIIRVAKSSDANSIGHIYRQYVEETTVSFEYQAPTDSEIKYRIKNTIKDYPWVVVEENNIVKGYAYASSHRDRAAYNWSADCSVYLSKEIHGKGFGKLLYKKIFNYLTQQNIVNVFAGIGLPNDRSVKFHESLGFKEIGTYKNIGFKFNNWWDVSWYQLRLCDPVQPEPFIPFSKLVNKN